MNIKRFFIVSSVLFFVNCSQFGSIEQKIGGHVEDCKKDAPCIVKIKDVTNFQWDRMYVFSLGVSDDEIEKTLGTPFPRSTEFKRRMIFTKDGKIVHSEDESTDIEQMTDGEVRFEGMETEPSQLSFTPDSAVFTSAKYSHSNGVFYFLTEIK